MELRSLRCCIILPLMFLLPRVFAGLPLMANKTAVPPVPAVFVFGDSIMDPGNNNELETIAKCNFPPYGKDFPGHKPTGRFSNGRIPSDMIASGLGLKEYVPAYLGNELTSEDILTGMSFGSGGSGFDPLTPELDSVLSMNDQLKLFEEYYQKLESVAGEGRAATVISESLYIICAGSNDLINTYFVTPFRILNYDIPSYVNLMTSYASSFIKQLCKLGARKIGFVGLPPIGCLPSQRTLAGGIARDCDPTRNEAAALFNSNFRQEIKRIQKELEGCKIVLIDIYSILLDLIQRPSAYGFEVSDKGCCATGEFEVIILCNSETASVCHDDEKYVFWDSYHPTERAYQFVTDDLIEKSFKYL